MLWGRWHLQGESSRTGNEFETSKTVHGLKVQPFGLLLEFGMVQAKAIAPNLLNENHGSASRSKIAHEKSKQRE